MKKILISIVFMCVVMPAPFAAAASMTATELEAKQIALMTQIIELLKVRIAELTAQLQAKQDVLTEVSENEMLTSQTITAPETKKKGPQARGSRGGGGSSRSEVVTPEPEETDLKLLSDCFSVSLTNNQLCVRADFNVDGVVDMFDLSLFDGVTQYDLSGDSMLDLTGASRDLTILGDCFSETTGLGSTCKKADFNVDGVVDMFDLSLFDGARSFDLNGDEKVTW